MLFWLESKKKFGGHVISWGRLSRENREASGLRKSDEFYGLSLGLSPKLIHRDFLSLAESQSHPAARALSHWFLNILQGWCGREEPQVAPIGLKTIPWRKKGCKHLATNTYNNWEMVHLPGKGWEGQQYPSQSHLTRAWWQFNVILQTAHRITQNMLNWSIFLKASDLRKLQNIIQILKCQLFVLSYFTAHINCLIHKGWVTHAREVFSASL